MPGAGLTDTAATSVNRLAPCFSSSRHLVSSAFRFEILTKIVLTCKLELDRIKGGRPVWPSLPCCVTCVCVVGRQPWQALWFQDPRTSLTCCSHRILNEASAFIAE